MGLPVLTELGVAPAAQRAPRCLYVVWQDPEARSMVPVARLCRTDEDEYEFQYLRRASELERFTPFVGFPDLHQVYRSSELFPFFENRLMPRTRDDYSDYLDSLAFGSEADPDPFEVLARSEGRRATDTIEVFPEPMVDERGVANCLFLVHGIRYVPGAQVAIDGLAVGDHLSILLDPQNKADPRAVLVRTDDYHLLGYVPAFLTSLVHRPLEEYGSEAIFVAVEHIGPRDGPSHLRLLCRLAALWPDPTPPLHGPGFELLESH